MSKRRGQRWEARGGDFGQAMIDAGGDQMGADQFHRALIGISIRFGRFEQPEPAAEPWRVARTQAPLLIAVDGSARRQRTRRFRFAR